MTSQEKFLTSEKLFQRFTSPFNLVNHAIEVAKTLVSRGEEHSNLANEVIELIAEGEDEDYDVRDETITAA